MLFSIKMPASSAAGTEGEDNRDTGDCAAGSEGEHNRDTDDCAAGFAVRCGGFPFRHYAHDTEHLCVEQIGRASCRERV